MPYGRRHGPQYLGLVRRIQQLVRDTLPAAASLAVISKGDERLVDLGNRRAWHFPLSAHGGYAGHHPADSREAVAQLEAIRALGAEFLLIPSTAYWWLEHYADFGRHLQDYYRRLAADDDICSIFDLRLQHAPPSPSAAAMAGSAKKHNAG
jgi:hypothetical protein